MKLHNMFKKTVGKEHGTSKNTKVRNVPEGLLKKCNKCGAAILAEDAVNNNYIFLTEILVLLNHELNE